jgi:hypothetical protein
MTGLSQWKIIGYAAAIFVAGGISGGALGVYETKSNLLVPPREQEMALRMRNRFAAKLGLSPDQIAKITPIIDSAAADLHSIRAETAQRMNKVFDDSYAQVSAILTPEQRIKLDQMQKERHEMMHRWQEGHRYPGPGGPGHVSPAPSAP